MELFSLCFATFFATIGPFDIVVVFLGLTGGLTAQRKYQIAIQSVVIALFLLTGFALFGGKILENFGISMAALRTGGGVLLLLMAVDMVFARESGATSPTPRENSEAQGRSDIAVFPLATPLIAGPGVMGAVVLMMSQAELWTDKLFVYLALALNLAFTLVCLLLGRRIEKILGVTGLQVATRVLGVLLAALSVQFIFDGIREAKLFIGMNP